MTPIARSFGRIEPRRDWLNATIGREGRAWFRADRLATDATELERLRLAMERQFGRFDPRTDGVMMMWRCADVARVATIVFALDQRVPDLRQEAVAFDPGSNDEPVQVAYSSPQFHCLPNDPAANHPDATIVPTLGELRRTLISRLETYIDPLIAPMSAVTHLGRKALWGIAASVSLVALAHALAEAGQPDEGVAEVQALLAMSTSLASSPPEFFVFEHAGSRHLSIRDGACCRAYLRPEADMCTSCPIRPWDERILLMTAYLDREAAAVRVSP